jgi:hypothetical protein
LAKHRPLLAFRLAVYLLLFGGCTGSILAQDEPNPATASKKNNNSGETAPKSAPAGENTLKILWLRNPATGDLVPVPGMTIDEYDKLDRLRKGLPPESAAPPNFVLSDLRLTGKVDGSTLACELEFEVELRDERWARIPLGLAKAALKYAPQEENWLVAPDDSGDGFILWAKGTAKEKKRLKLQFDCALEAKSTGTRIQLSLPRARSEVAEITIAGDEASVRMDGSGAIDSMSSRAEGTIVQCSRFANNLDLSWSSKSKHTAAESWLEAAGAVEIRVDGRRQIRMDAKLRLRRFGAMSSTLEVRLPSGMRLSPDAPTISAAVQSFTTAEQEGDQVRPKSQSLMLELAPDAPNEIELRIQAESDGPIALDAAQLDLGGIEIVGAKRHWGIVDLSLSSDWYAAPTQSANVRRIDAEPSAAESTFSRIRFEYATQPALIVIAARLPRTLVEPAYEIFVESGQLRLESMLKYRFRGPSASGVEIDLGDWTFERATSLDGMFLVEEIQQEGGKLIIPLSPQPLPTGAETTLRLEARKNGGEQSIQFHLPVLTANVEAPATARVLADVNLDLIPRMAEFKGVSVDSTMGAQASPQQRGQLVYRTRPGVERPFLAFDIQVRKQALYENLTTQLLVSPPRELMIQHEIQLSVSYEPLREIVLELPLAGEVLDSARVLLEDQPLERTSAVELEEEEDREAKWMRCRYNLPQAYLGSLKLVVQYPVPATANLSGGVTQVLLPRLSTTSEIQSAPHQLIVRDPARLTKLNTNDWTRDFFSGAGALSAGSELYSSIKPRTSVTLEFAETAAPRVSASRIEKWWLQSTLTNDVRSDRLCLRISGWSAPLSIKLPTGADLSSVTAAIDGVKADFVPVTDATLEGRLSPPNLPGATSRVIEIWYQCEMKPLSWGQIQLSAPTIDGKNHLERSYWQVLTPADWYSLRRPAGWTFEHTVGSSAVAWGFEPSLRQAALEKWVGATIQSEPPAELNQYLFSTFSTTTDLALVLAPRRDVWLVGLATTFVLGALVIQFRWLRRPLTFLAVGSLAAMVLIFEPHWSVGLAQLLMIGLGATLLVWLLRLMLVSPKLAPTRSTPSHASARSLETTALSPESGASGRRGSSIRNTPASASVGSSS